MLDDGRSPDLGRSAFEELSDKTGCETFRHLAIPGKPGNRLPKFLKIPVSLIPPIKLKGLRGPRISEPDCGQPWGYDLQIKR